MKEKITGFIKNFPANWKAPAQGKYVSYKEVAAYSVGGMGVNFIIAMIGHITMSAGCLLIGSAYKIKPMDMALIMTIATILSIVIIPIRGAIVDNPKGKKGKWRPIFLWTTIPTALVTLAMAFIPTGWGYLPKVIMIGVGFNILNMLNTQFFYPAYMGIAHVITPNTDERAGIISISSIIFSLAPTITGFLSPLIAEWMGTDMTDINVYRVIFPVFIIIGLCFSFLAYIGTKERVVVPKSYVAKVKFWHGMKSISKNKYFWISNISSWFAFARVAASVLFTWVFVYQIQNNYIQSILTTVIGTASLIGMVTAPLLIKLMGKKNLIIISNIIYALCYLVMMFFTESSALIIIMTYLAFAANATSIVSLPSSNADVLDYQQWRTGERLEGFAGNFGMISAVIGIGTAYIVPFFTQCFGLIDNYDILYDPAIRGDLFKVYCLLSVIGAVLTGVPYLFYDLSEKKHKAIIEDLKQRAYESNKADGVEGSMEDMESELAKNTEFQDMAKKLVKHEKVDSHITEIQNNGINNHNVSETPMPLQNFEVDEAPIEGKDIKVTTEVDINNKCDKEEKL